MADEVDGLPERRCRASHADGGAAADGDARPAGESTTSPTSRRRPPPTTAELADAEFDVDVAALVAERDQYKDLAQRVQADFENFRKRGRSSRPRPTSTGPPVGSPRRCCRCSTPPRPPTCGIPTRSGRCSTCCSAELQQARASRRSTSQDQPFDPEVAEAVAHEPGDGGEVVVAEVLRSGYLWNGPDPARRDGPDARLKQRIREATMAAQREWFEKDYYKVLGVAADAAQPRTSPRRTASWRASCTPTRTPATPAAEERFKEVSAAYDVLGDETKRDGVRRGPPARPDGGGRPAAVGPAGSRSTSATCSGGDSATCSARCSAAAARGGGSGAASVGPATRRRRQAAAHASTSPTPARGITTTLHLTSDAQCSHLPRVGRQARHDARRCARCAVAAASSTTTRACSRSRRRAGAARAAGTVIERPVPDVPRAAASSAGPARSRSRIPAGVSRTARRSGSRAAARPAATAARPATCSSRSRQAAPAVRSRRATT